VACCDSILQLLFVTWLRLGNIEEARVLSNDAKGNSIYTRETQ
jgi:hypothetical protein